MSGFPAAARICLPRDVNSRKTVRRARSTGTAISVSSDMPLNTTPPTWTFELKGCGNVACEYRDQTWDVRERQQYLAHADRQNQKADRQKNRYGAVRER